MNAATCPVCRGTDTSLYRSYQIPGPAGDRTYRLVLCGDCRLVFTHPQPGPDQLHSIYGDDAYYAYQPFLMPDPTAPSGPVRRVRQLLKTAIIDHYYQYGHRCPGFRPHPGMRVLGALTRSLAREDMLYNRRVIAFNHGGRHLDIGCGSGYYVWWMEKHGWQSEGIEINETAVKHAQDRGLNVQRAALPDSHLSGDAYDLVTAWGVVEHLSELTASLTEIARIMKPGGRFIGFVPNIESWDAGWFRENWQGLEIPSHLYHFTPTTLRGVLSRAGLMMDRVEYLPGIDCWKASLDKIGVTGGWRRSVYEWAGRLSTILANRFWRGAMFRFDAVKK